MTRPNDNTEGTMKLITWYHIVTVGLGLIIIGGMFASEMLEYAMLENLPKTIVFFISSCVVISLGLAFVQAGYDSRKSLDQV